MQASNLKEDIMNRLKDKYNQEVLPKLKEEFGIKNTLATPRLEKIIINVGVGDAKDKKEILDQIFENISALSGQKPVVTRAKHAISGFKLSAGQPVGIVATLRGDRMYEFLDKLISIVLPKVRDFRGVPANAFDGQGNYNLGLREQTIFPEVVYRRGSDRARGMQISVVTTAGSKEQGKRLLELLGMPFRGE